MTRKSFVLLPLAVAMCVAGCSFAPTYERPEAPIEAAWPVSEATKNVKLLTEGLQQWGEFFRDERLKKTALGRLFIRVYYRLSPPAAARLRNARHVNRLVRRCLDRWVQHLEQRQ